MAVVGGEPEPPSVESSYERFRSRRVFGSLDGLRALSVLAVIWHHVPPLSLESAPYLLANGQHGVTLFFAISGFLIVTLLLREHERAGRIDLKAFYIRRTLRIFPLYYSVVALYTLLVYLLERRSAVGQEFFRNLPYFVTYTSNWFILLEGRVIFYFAWSLAAEEQFYLVWPTVQKFATKATALVLLCAVVLVVTATQLFSSSTLPDGAATLRRAVVGLPLAICFGVLLAYALHHRRTFDALRWAFASPTSSVAWIAILLTVLNWRGAPEVLVHLSAAMVVGACVYREDHWLSSLLRLRAVAHVGAVSYGIYLLHMLVKNATVKIAEMAHIPLAPYAIFVLTAVFTILAATLSYRYFESFFLRMKPRLTTR